ncbi:hypothetical protein [Chromobacterium sp. LK1]|uniref:hypothetical protein n=1 Tax=Chromobacterium sp. LK1 TaxID=1628193 RepID=UPI0012E1C37E|nr:hypothetical protein [Chromobacterium sp. LK1]
MSFDIRPETSVAVLFYVDAGERMEALVGKMPVWVVDSAKNRDAVQRVRSHYKLSNITLFFDFEGESKTSMCSRLIYDISDHHEFSTIELHGIAVADVNQDIITDLEFKRVVPTHYGCVLIKV